MSADGQHDEPIVEGTLITEPEPEAPDPVAVTISGLTQRYGDLFAVRDLHMTIPRGVIFGLIGPNGAGKTTTFSVMATLLKPTGGKVEVLGSDPVQRPKDVRRHLGFMPDVVGVYDGLRVHEYLEFFAAAQRVPRARWRATIDTLLELVELTAKRAAAVDSLSRGMKQRLSLARALVHDPEVLVLDEPASGLDPRARVELRDLLLQLQAMGKTIVISSHILSELSELCSRIGIMERGVLLADGSPAEIRAQLGNGRRVQVRVAGEAEPRTYDVTDDDNQRTLLRSLVDEGVPVLEFSEVHEGLEELFMQITTGEVQ